MVLDLNIQNHRLSLITVYGPNEDTPLFYEELFEIINEVGNKDIIVVGDFNLIMDPDIDYYNYLHLNNPKARYKVLENINQFNFIDMFRETRPD